MRLQLYELLFCSELCLNALKWDSLRVAVVLVIGWALEYLLH